MKAWVDDDEDTIDGGRGQQKGGNTGRADEQRVIRSACQNIAWITH